MTLQERIADVLEKHQLDYIGMDFEYYGCAAGCIEQDQLPPIPDRNFYLHQAQVVIDELGLEIETRDRLHYPSSHASPPTGGTRQVRYVTKWENQRQWK